jgi:hypothetical protein
MANPAKSGQLGMSFNRFDINAPYWYAHTYYFSLFHEIMNMQLVARHRSGISPSRNFLIQRSALETLSARTRANSSRMSPTACRVHFPAFNQLCIRKITHAQTIDEECYLHRYEKMLLRF